MKKGIPSRLKGEHVISIHISYELKEKLKTLADRFDRTMADMVRTVLRIGVPIMEGISEAEEKMIKEYARVARKFRRSKSLKDI
jgi:predicted DNA-binding protein